MSLWVLLTYGLIAWLLGSLQGYQWGTRDGQSKGYLRGYRDGGKGKTFKRDKETY